MTPWDHAVSSAEKFGGTPDDYIKIHNWFDETKQYTGNWTHRMLRHHAAGVEWAISLFGHAVTNSDGKPIPVKIIAEQHVNEDIGFVPTISDWTDIIKDHPRDWMLKVQKKKTQTIELK